MHVAHSRNASGSTHALMEHLRRVAELAGEFAGKFEASELGRWAGLWHDLGKFHPDFQAYIAAPGRRHGPDHSSAGAVHAAAFFHPLAFPVAGHHGGLPSRTDLKTRLAAKRGSPPVDEALKVAQDVMGDLRPPEGLEGRVPPFLGARSSGGTSRERRVDLFLRMVFSALVDADFLDTEAHFDPDRALRRTGVPALDELWERFEAAQATLTGRRVDPVNRLRHEIYKACLGAADLGPGIFALTVPTGGGKTRSGMAFALRHALRHGLDRIIVAIPYTSIIEQTANEYRTIFGDAGVLEHHSAVATRDEDASPASYTDVWARLASQNWDAPVVVTTTVQLFESLFGNRPAACRKLHNLTRSVLILDEVQMLPVHLLAPILDVVQELSDHYSVTVVLCTATQPALREGAFQAGLRGVREIVPDPAHYFSALRRVEFERPSPGERWSWERVATELQTAPSALAIVNTKRDAFALLDALADPDALHLSTQMCGRHRYDTLVEVRRRLAAGEPCRLISTQVVEAGVDLDFPLVLRAMAPLDRIVQAAGRCNREGRLATGRVVVFEPEAGGAPAGVYRSGIETARVLLADKRYDLHDPGTYETYFRQLFQVATLDARGIQAMRERFDYPAVAEAFRMIDDDGVPAVVRPKPYRDEVDRLLALAERAVEPPRSIMRALQPYLVNLRSRAVARYQAGGLLREVRPGLWEWLGAYDSVRGLVEAPRDPEELVI